MSFRRRLTMASAWPWRIRDDPTPTVAHRARRGVPRVPASAGEAPSTRRGPGRGFGTHRLSRRSMVTYRNRRRPANRHALASSLPFGVFAAGFLMRPSQSVSGTRLTTLETDPRTQTSPPPVHSRKDLTFVFLLCTHHLDAPDSRTKAFLG